MALCTYNGAQYVARQIDSVLHQTVLPVRIVLADDGSSDGTVEAARAAFDQRPAEARRVTLTVLPSAGASLGVTENFARAIAATTTEFVALSDQDDVWEPGRIAAGLRVLREHRSVLLVASNTSFIDGTDRPLPGDTFSAFGLSRQERTGVMSGDVLPVLVRRNFLQGMTFLLRRSLVELAGPAPPGLLHDYWLALHAAARNGIHVLPDRLVRYRQHGRNVVGTGERRRVVRWAKGLHWFLVRPRSGTPERLALWRELTPRLVSDDVPAPRRALLQQKLAFEEQRFRSDRSLPAQLRCVAGLVRSGAYRRYDRAGAWAAFTDGTWVRS